MKRLLLWVATLVLSFPIQAQETWSLQTRCLPDAVDAPAAFNGAILTYEPDEGVRALRSTVATTYYIAFEGSNFTGAGALSPDGKWFALPYGYIQTVATSDVRYIINELRVHSTEPVPRITARLAWKASYAVEDGIPPIRWRDNETLLLANDGDLVEVNPFTQEIAENDLDVYSHLSPDLTRGFAPHFEQTGLFDLESGDLLERFPTALTDFRWSPDSALFATDGNPLTLYDPDGQPVETVMEFSDDQLLRNFRWSPDGNRFAFSLYDPYKNENFLYIGDRSSKTITDTCTRLNNLHDGQFTADLAWSPDGSQLALLAFDAGLLIYDLPSDALHRAAEYTGGILGWGDGTF